jgi:tetratricopeptide (TPR) repeat protein
LLKAFLSSRAGRLAEATEERRAGRALAEELEDNVTVVAFHVLEARLLLERGDVDGVLRETERAQDRLPHVANTAIRELQKTGVQAAAGIALARSGRVDEAKERLARIGDARDFAEAPPRWFANALAGEIALQEGRLEDAEAAYAAGVAGKKAFFNLGAMPPTAFVQNAPFRDGLARIRNARGDWRGAIEAYRALNTPAPDNPWTSWLEPRFVLETARLLREHGETEEARVEYERFLELWDDADPDLPELQEARLFLGRDIP